MLRIPLTTCRSSGELLDSSLDTAEFYGFKPLKQALKSLKPARALKLRANPNLYSVQETRLASLTKTLIAHGMHRHDKTTLSYELENKASKVAAMHLHVVGSRSSIAEGMLLATIATIANENGIANPIVHINSLGDKESALRFVRELTAYMRSIINDLPAYAREEMHTTGAICAFLKLIEKHHELASNAPSPMEFLNDESRGHLHDVLEYTEHIGLPYELDPTLIGSNDCWYHTLFDVRTSDENGNEVTFARGGRHDALAHKAFRVELPAVSVTLEHEIQGRTKTKHRPITHPKFFFAQLGAEAKMKGFKVLRQLKDAGIPIAQQVTLDSISSQLSHVDTATMPYTVIIGHKEALEDTAIVRNMNDRSQVVVPLTKLPLYLRKLKV